jgi:threonylcarbamoyladenosine tRNA methylthiotransferase MtaB
MKYAVITFGCRVNQADSLLIEDDLRARGGMDVAPHEADLVVVNTCSVTASADQGARQTIRRIARDNPAVRIVVTGCYATREPAAVSSLPNVVRVVPNPRKDALLDELDVAGLTTASRYAAGDGPCGEALHPGVAGRTALTIRVQTGCDAECSYCIIPRTRGSGRSLPLAAVLHRVALAVSAGYKEIAIAGVHLGSYGRDLGDGTTLGTLLAALAEWPEDVLFRISSLEPMDCTAALVDLVAQSDRLAPHFHLPLQHGADRMLRAMRRPYTAREYRALIERIAERMPHASVGTDLIAGFPGEDDEAFEATVSLAAALPFSHLHVFPYSDRPGTEASCLPGKVEGVVIRDRARMLRELGAAASRRFQERQIGSVRRALTVEDGSRAVTDNYLKLRIAPGHERNEWVEVEIEGAPGALTGSRPPA